MLLISSNDCQYYFSRVFWIDKIYIQGTEAKNVSTHNEEWSVVKNLDSGRLIVIHSQLSIWQQEYKHMINDKNKIKKPDMIIPWKWWPFTI